MRRHAPCGEGGASVCAPDGEGGAGGAPCGDWRGQRERRRTGPPVARAARAWARPMAIGEGGASVVGDSAKTACCDNVPLARYFHHFYAISDAVACTSTLPNGLTPYAVVRVCDNGSNVAQESDLALLEP